jgi:CHAT domain-containing protein/tetratricopeptide (TPR) repeat protein
MKKSIIVFTFLIISKIGHCQCDPDQVLWQYIMKIDTISNDSLLYKNIIALKKKKELCKQTTDSVYAKSLHILSRVYMHFGEINYAVEYCLKSININSSRKKNVSERQSGLTYFNLAEIESYNLQNYPLAINYYDKCIQVFEKHNFRKELVALSYSKKASIYFSLGDYQKSIENADKAIFLAGHENTLVKIASVTEKIQSLIELNNYKDANILLDKYLIVSQKEFKNTQQLANLYFLKGWLFGKQNNFSQAQKYYYLSLKIHQINGYVNGSCQMLLSIGDLLIENKSFEKALEALNKSLLYSKEVPSLKLRAMDNIGMVFFNLKKYSLAITTFQGAFSEYFRLNLNSKIVNLELLKKATYKEYLFLLFKHKAETWLAYYHHTNKKEYLQNSLETFAVADKMVDYMRREHVGYQSKLFWRDKTHSLYENAIEVCHLLKNYEKAFYFFEKSRAVLLNDKINNLSANQMLSNADQLKERSFQQEISKLNSEIESETVEAKKSVLNVKMLDIQDAQQKFIKNLAAKYPSYFQFKYDTSMYNLGQLRQYLQKSNTSFIEYFKGDSANYQLVIKRTGVNIIKQKPPENTYQYLINASDLGKKVIVSQDGEFVPLDTLKNIKGEILLNKYAFSNTYSAQYLLRNAEKPATNSWLNNFIGFAPVNYSKSMSLPSLLGADAALANVSGNYFWPKNYEKKQATKANFTQKASDYKIIQLFTHADADNVNKEPTIFFADSAMKVSELESFGHFNTELLVLSACKTNVGKVAKGEGTLSMAREFAGLGIPATITTLWSVENEATYQITELFYKYLKKGEPKDVALQKAKLEYLELNSREKQNPKYWAAFVLMGETAPLAGFDGKIVYFGGVISLLILAIVVYFMKRKRAGVGQIPNFVN